MKQRSRFCGCFRREMAERPVANRRQKKDKLPDVIILGPVKVSKRQLLTRNIKDFPGNSWCKGSVQDLMEAVGTLHECPTWRRGSCRKGEAFDLLITHHHFPRFQHE